MLLTITTTHRPATDLGYLLHKNPSRLQTAELAVGKAHVYYPEATDERCTVAVLLEVDPIALVRGKGGEGGRFEDYVNDRPYAASSFLSSAILEFFSTAMGGRSKERPELAETAIPLRVQIPVLPVHGGDFFLRALFEPLGYRVTAERLPLDGAFPEWGDSPYFRVELENSCRLADLLCHLYVLTPVLDDRKHYYIGQDEVEKLLRRGGAWLANHPMREAISHGYLRHNRMLTSDALARLREIDDLPDEVEEIVERGEGEAAFERPASLHDLRLVTVYEALRDAGASRVIDLGCGEGRLLQILLNDDRFSEILGMDVSILALERAKRRLKLDDLPERRAARIKLIHGSLLYRDRRLEGYDAAALVEVIEHLDAARLESMERVVFEFARPGAVVVTTPNREYNALFETLPPGSFRHQDHRFEWTREEFDVWVRAIADRHGYRAVVSGVGLADNEYGAPSQMAVFTR